MRARLQRLRQTSAWTFIGHLYQRAQASKLTLLAAALAFYAAFSLGPLLLLLAGGFGLLLGRRPGLEQQVQDVLVGLVAQLMPLQDEVARIQVVEQSFQALLTLLQEGALPRAILSLVVLVWASSNFFTSLQLALELIFAAEQPRAFWRKRLVAILLIFMVGLVIFFELIGGLFIAYLGQLFELLQQFLELLNVPPQSVMPTPRIPLSELLRALITTAAFTLCFRYLPRRSSDWLGAFIGGVFSTASILLMRELLKLTFNLERFNLIYGVITSLLFVLLWLYFALLLFLVGALLAADISSRRRRQAGERRETPT